MTFQGRRRIKTERKRSLFELETLLFYSLIILSSGSYSITKLNSNNLSSTLGVYEYSKQANNVDFMSSLYAVLMSMENNMSFKCCKKKLLQNFPNGIKLIRQKCKIDSNFYSFSFQSSNFQFCQFSPLTFNFYQCKIR